MNGRTLDGLAVERGRDLVDRVRDLPVFVPDLDEAHRGLGGGPRREERVRAAARDGLRRGRADDERLRAHRRVAVDVRADVQLDNIALGQGLLRERIRRERRVVRDAVVDGDAGREREAWRT